VGPICVDCDVSEDLYILILFAGGKGHAFDFFSDTVYPLYNGMINKACI
jgi:hypothetical protein